MHQPPPTVRRQWIVDHALQRRMVLAQAWPPLLALAFASALLCYFCVRLADEATMSGVILPSLFAVVASAIAFLVATGVFVVVFAVRFSHRVAGPMHRICSDIRSFRDGDDSQRITLRAEDYLAPIVGELNELLQLAADLRTRATAAQTTGSVPAAAAERQPTAAAR